MEKNITHNMLVRIGKIDYELAVKANNLNAAQKEADEFGTSNNIYRKDGDNPKPINVSVFDKHQELLRRREKLRGEYEKLVDERKKLEKRIIECIKAINGNILQTSLPQDGAFPNEIISAHLNGEDLVVKVDKKS